MKPPRDLVFVSAGLGLDGGGRAVAGRLLAGACADFARRRGIALHLLTLSGGGLPAEESPATALPAKDFGGNARDLAFHVWKRQLTNRREAYVFDLLGPARAQTYLPGLARAPYLLPMYGIEVWHPLEWDRRRALARATVRFAISPLHPGAGPAVLPRDRGHGRSPPWPWKTGQPKGRSTRP